MNDSQSPSGDSPNPVRMLRLPIRARMRCGCVPVAIVLIAIGVAIGARAWSARQEAAVTPDAVPSRALTSTPDVVVTPTFTLTAAPTWTPELPTATVELTPLPTATAAPTETALPPTPTLPPAPTATITPLPTAAPTQAATPTPGATAVPDEDQTPTGVVACGGEIQAAIEQAADAQARYMEGALGAGDLEAAWGRTASDAQTQADRMIGYRDGGIQSVRITGVTWALSGCQMIAYDGWAQVTVSEQWTYEAELTCASGGARTSVWTENFAAESYALVRGLQGWQIESWLTGTAVADAKWTCP
jgi:hypothetical protein